MDMSPLCRRPTSGWLAQFFSAVALPIALPLAVAVAISGSAAAAESCDFFKGKTVNLVVPFSSGGGFDVYGRMVARHMGPELGASAMIVLNQPGAGGLLATNKTWIAKPDGLTIQLMSTSGMITSELGGADGVNFKTGEFSWIGRVSGEPDVVATAPASKIKSIDDLKALASQRKIRIGSSGIGDIDYIEATLLGEVLGVNTDIITGFGGAPEVYASLGRGELDMFASSESAAVQAEKAETARATWVLDSEAIPDRPDAKPLTEVVDPKMVPLIKAHADVIAAGRALAGPPGISQERLKCLRDAFDRAISSEALIKESVQLKRPVAALSGQKTADLIKGVTTAPPPEYLKVIQKSFGK